MYRSSLAAAQAHQEKGWWGKERRGEIGSTPSKSQWACDLVVNNEPPLTKLFAFSPTLFVNPPSPSMYIVHTFERSSHTPGQVIRNHQGPRVGRRRTKSGELSSRCTCHCHARFSLIKPRYIFFWAHQAFFLIPFARLLNEESPSATQKSNSMSLN